MHVALDNETSWINDWEVTMREHLVAGSHLHRQVKSRWTSARLLYHVPLCTMFWSLYQVKCRTITTLLHISDHSTITASWSKNAGKSKIVSKQQQTTMPCTTRSLWSITIPGKIVLNQDYQHQSTVPLCFSISALKRGLTSCVPLIKARAIVIISQWREP